MKIAFVGKGGSGKTSISAVFSKYIHSRKKYVLAIDSDLNQLLAFNIAPDQPLKEVRSLGNHHDMVAKYFRHNNPRIRPNGTFNRTTPPGTGSRLIRLQQKDELLDFFISKVDGIDLLSVGQPTQKQIGERCYHTNMSVNEILLNHTVDKKDEYIVADLTAGIDTIISGMLVSYDIVFTIIEPSLHSVKVYKDYKRIADRTGFKSNIIPIANKINSEEDIRFIEDNIGQEIQISFGISEYFRKIKRGQKADIDKRTEISLEKLFNTVNGNGKDWENFYKGLLLFHKKRAMSMGEKVKNELLEQVDPEFNIEKEVRKLLRHE